MFLLLLKVIDIFIDIFILYHQIFAYVAGVVEGQRIVSEVVVGHQRLEVAEASQLALTALEDQRTRVRVVACR